MHNQIILPKTRVVLSLGYWFGAHTLGMLVHPYQSVRRIVREKVFVPLLFLPSVMLVCWWALAVVVARVGVLARLGLGGVAEVLGGFWGTQLVLSFVVVWVGVSLVVWQVVVGYLGIRFGRIRI